MRRKYSKEVKLAVLQDLEAGKTTAEVCRQYEVDSSVVRRWRLEYRRDPVHAFSGKGNASTADARITELERSLGRLYVENEFLKKALDVLRKRLAEGR